MAKETGAGLDRLIIDGINVSGNIGALQTIAAKRALGDVTDITQSAFDRRGLLGDGELAFSAWWDGTAVSGAHQTLKTMRNNGILTYSHGVVLGSPAACLTGSQVEYAISRSPDGTLAATVSAQASGGAPLEWGVLLTAAGGQPYQTFGAAGNGSDVDDLAGVPTSTAFGATLYVQLLAFTGTSVTVKVQDAATLPTYADVAGLTTSALNAIGAARAVTSSPTATIRRYTRIVTTGTFSNAVIAAVLVRNMSAQS